MSSTNDTSIDEIERISSPYSPPRDEKDDNNNNNNDDSDTDIDVSLSSIIVPGAEADCSTIIVKRKPFSILRSFTEIWGEFIKYVVTPAIIPIVYMNIIPDFIIRYGMRREIASDMIKSRKLSVEDISTQTREFVSEIKRMPIAIETKLANKQHYEVPDEFYQLVLGPHLKYSSGYWPSSKTTLVESEVAMLELYCERAELFDGMKLIDLGCGWGSLSLYMAAKYPNSTIISVSNSNTQRGYIMATAKARGLNNITVYTGDINNFDLTKDHYNSADRVMSIEMFEHMKNYQLLMHKISNWMKRGGKLFIHIFTHRDVPSHYSEGWMTETFFTGGTLPSDRLLLHFQEHVTLESHWCVNGTHYQRTLEAWLIEMDRKKSTVMPILVNTYGEKNALMWYVSWRLFFIGCAEFFGANKGNENIVSHYLFTKKN